MHPITMSLKFDAKLLVGQIGETIFQMMIQATNLA